LKRQGRPQLRSRVFRAGYIIRIDKDSALAALRDSTDKPILKPKNATATNRVAGPGRG
jgi:hypothetical protein